jgi:Na+/citrate or Na+/malate symporter
MVAMPGSVIFVIGTTVAGCVVGMIVGGVHGTINDYTMPEASPDSAGGHGEGSVPRESNAGTPGSGANGR